MSLPVFLVAFSSIDRVPNFTLHIGFVIVRGSQVELIVDDALLPFTV